MCKPSEWRGVNLIDSAIVLGIVGLVLGGIWWAAGAVNDTIKWRKTEKGWYLILNEVMQELDYRTVSSLGSSYNATIWFRASIPVPDGWKKSQVDHGLTYRLHDPEGYGITVGTGIFGSTPYVSIGYMTPMYASPSGSLPKRHCARMYALLKELGGNTYKVVRWGDLPAGCNPWSLNGFQSFYDSSCCPGRPQVWYAAKK